MANNTSEHETNKTGEYNDSNDSVYTVLALYGMLGILIVAANTLVLFLVYKKRQLRTVTNNFLVSLAVSDLSTGLVAIPMAIACSLTVTKSNAIPVQSFAMDICVRFLAFSSVTHLTVLTMERYIRITKPFEYRSRVTGARTYRVIGGVWGFSLLASFIQLFWILNPEEDRQIEIIYDSVSFALVVVVPLFLISGLYIAMFRFIRSHNARRGEVLAMSMNKANIKRANQKGEKKLLVVFLVMIVVFILGSFTYFFWTILNDLHEYYIIGPVADTNMEIVTMFFRYFSSLCNPLLLTFFKQDFYEALMSVMGRRRQPLRENRGQSTIHGKRASDEL